MKPERDPMAVYYFFKDVPATANDAGGKAVHIVLPAHLAKEPGDTMRFYSPRRPTEFATIGSMHRGMNAAQDWLNDNAPGYHL